MPVLAEEEDWEFLSENSTLSNECYSSLKMLDKVNNKELGEKEDRELVADLGNIKGVGDIFSTNPTIPSIADALVTVTHSVGGGGSTGHREIAEEPISRPGRAYSRESILTSKEELGGEVSPSRR